MALFSPVYLFLGDHYELRSFMLAGYKGGYFDDGEHMVLGEITDMVSRITTDFHSIRCKYTSQKEYLNICYRKTLEVIP